MAAMARKLIVEVVDAKDLLPKDGTGTSSPYVLVEFDGQLRRTHTVHRDLNPAWNQALEFDLISNGVGVTGEQLELEVMHDRRVGPSRRNNFLGRLKLDSRQFVNKGEEALIYFPLEKKSFWNWVRGEIGLRVYYVDVPIAPPAPPSPPPDEAKPDEAPPTGGEVPTLAEASDATIAAKADDALAAEAAVSQAEVDAPPPAAEIEVEARQVPEAGEQLVENIEVTEADQPPSTEDVPENRDYVPVPEVLPAEEPAVARPPPPAPAAAKPKEEAPRWVAPLQTKPMHRQAAPDVIERSKFDLVDKMQYMFVRVVRARSLPGDAWPHVRISASGRHVTTATARRVAFFFDWDQTFAFARDPAVVDSSNMEIAVWDLPPEADADARGADKHFLGGVCFDVSEVPTRDPPDSPLAPQWYRLEGGRARGGDLMLATWVGTQADESFRTAWKADAPARHAASGSKIYQSPKLWYLCATVLEVQDVFVVPSREFGFSIKATLGFQSQRSRPASTRNGSLAWNEDLIFIAPEPFSEDQKLVVSLETRQGKETILLGSAAIPLSSIERRVDDRKVASKWLDLLPGEDTKKTKRKGGGAFGGRLHVRVCLDGGYHVSDEPQHATSDYRPSARQLWQPPVGILELGIIGCRNLLPMRTVDGKGTTDAYAVAKYGPKWARTRTVADRFDPAWNEQYTWEVHDPCTVITVGVFDESDSSKDSTSRPMGRIRIRISTLESNRPYRGSYPLILMLPSGAKRMGEIELSVRFARARSSSLEVLSVYVRPMLPPMHHLRPLPQAQCEQLRLAAARIVAAHLSRAEPPLRREVVMYMLDAAEPRGFSMRRVRANWHRIVSALSWVTDATRWVQATRTWRNPKSTMLAHGVMLLITWHPELLGPALALHACAAAVWAYRRRPGRLSPHPCVRASGVEGADRDELDEEFDPVTSTRPPELVRARYDRARAVGVRVQVLLGDFAAQAERLQALVSWHDPRATGMFVLWSFVIAMVLLVVPLRILALVMGFFYMRHPMFRDRMPPPAMNFFKRLPSLSDRML